MNVCVFLGMDIHSHILINRVLTDFRGKSNFKFKIFLVKRLSAKVQHVGVMAKYLRLEQHVLPEVICEAYREDSNFDNQKCVPSCLFPRSYCTVVQEVSDINEDRFVGELAKENFTFGIAIRSYQKFGSRIIRFFEEQTPNGLLNLHPGTVPMYRGVMSFFREMFDGSLNGSYSLHRVTEKWDAGPVLARCDFPFDYKRAVLSNYLLAAKHGARCFGDFMSEIATSRSVHSVDQDTQVAMYWGFPNADIIEKAERRGLSLVDVHDFSEIISSLYGEYLFDKLRSWSAV